MLSFLKKFGGRQTLSNFAAEVERVNRLEPDIQKLDNEALRKESFALKDRIEKRGMSEDAVVRAFALVREAAVRTLGQRPFDAQLMGGLALERGAIAEMVTGEGKTLAAVAPAYLHALSGKGAHVVTVNEYLARRDAVWMGQIYRALGLSVACLVPNAAYLYDPEWRIPEPERDKIDAARDTTGSFLVQQEFLRPITRREAYLADITYGTNHEFGFDYLRDNLAYSTEGQVQRGHHYAIIDEVDSILIDEARTPLIISAPDVASSEHYKTFARVVMLLAADADYTVDEKLRSVSITEQGIEKVEKLIGIKNLYEPQNIRLVHYLEESLRAKALFKKDKDYVVKNDEIVIVDEFTGRLLHGRRYSGGLHQAIEAKEKVRVKEESRTYAKISIQNYFRMYEKISGMTGTAQTSAEEFHKVYRLEVIRIPTNRPLIRKDLTDVIYKTEDAKFLAATEEIKKRHDAGQPVLVGTASITKNELMSAYLARKGIPHEVLNAKNNEREGAIIAQAGKLKAVTVATNVAGRGVDIILGGNPPDEEESKRVRELGGLHVIGTERHEARRIDNQLRGRAGRQGDSGSSQFFLSLDDDLLRIFGGDRIKGLMERFHLPDDQPIEVGIVGKAVQQAQAKVEGANFDLRKHLLEYDDVLNKQRAAIYRERQKILESLREISSGGELAKIVGESALGYFDRVVNQVFGEEEAWSEEGTKEIKRLFEEASLVNKDWKWPEEPTEEALRSLITRRSVEVSLDPMTLPRALGILDLLWMNHLEDLEALSESIGLRAYGQKDPLVEYRREAHRLFQNFWGNFNGWIFMNIFKFVGQSADAGGAQPQRIADSAAGKGVGRNDPCPCGAKRPDGRPYKYKQCGLINASHHRK
ncbi:MAG: preprotein translocase subunit SecA [Candidatus Liptonbacteria bacterium]|nr:preprotein translocase subunit SecA [Candidatus Liptonbacteria bacterium]